MCVYASYVFDFYVILKINSIDFVLLKHSNSHTPAGNKRKCEKSFYTHLLEMNWLFIWLTWSIIEAKKRKITKKNFFFNFGTESHIEWTSNGIRLHIVWKEQLENKL